ncbi:UNVERIFIED_CONTAM: hypothetical protein K2H54_056653 [Gekko kuhli]
MVTAVCTGSLDMREAVLAHLEVALFIYGRRCSLPGSMVPIRRWPAQICLRSGEKPIALSMSHPVKSQLRATRKKSCLSTSREQERKRRKREGSFFFLFF